MVAEFALLLNPIVVVLERRLRLRRGAAVSIAGLLAALAFLGLALAFGYPLVNGITHLANRLPSYVPSAESGKGWIGHIARKYRLPELGPAEHAQAGELRPVAVHRP